MRPSAGSLSPGYAGGEGWGEGGSIRARYYISAAADISTASSANAAFDALAGRSIT